MIESFYKNSRRLWNLICNFLLSRILWLQVVKCSNVRHFPSPSRICKCCNSCVFFRGYHHIICHPLLKKGVPCVCKTYHWGVRGVGVGEVYYSLCPRGEENSWMPRSTPRGWPGLQMTALVQWSVFQVMQKWQTKFKSVFQSDEKTRNEIQIRFQSNAKTKNEKRNSYPFFKVMRKLNEKRKLKFIVVFQSWAKTKNKKQNSNLFFDVMRKRKMEISLEFPFPMPSKNGWH